MALHLLFTHRIVSVVRYDIPVVVVKKALSSKRPENECMYLNKI
jgi:hypothetical protein